MRRSSANAVENVDHFSVVEGVVVGGAAEKDVLLDPATGSKYIAKLGGKNGDIEVVTEYAIHLIGRSLGVNVARAKIGTFRGRLRFMSEYFLDTNEELVHGMQLFRELYDEGAVAEVVGNEAREQALFTVQSIRDALGAHYVHYGPAVVAQLFDGFIAMVTHDALIGVHDRHHENWGIVVHRSSEGTEPRFAPLYDSARGLFCNETDAQIKTRYSGRPGHERLDGFVSRARPLFGFAGLVPANRRKYVTHDQLLAAVFTAFPDQRTRIVTILQTYDWQAVRSLLRTELAGLCAPQRFDLVLTCLRRRQRLLWRAIHGSGFSPIY